MDLEEPAPTDPPGPPPSEVSLDLDVSVTKAPITGSRISRRLVIAVALASLIPLTIVGVAATILRSSADAALVASIAEAIAGADSDGSESAFDIGTATCAAETTVDEIGADRMAELGVTPDDVGEIEEIGFDESELRVIIDALDDCGDLLQLFADELLEDGNVSQEQADCFVDEFDLDIIKDTFVAQLQGDESDEALGPFFTELGEVAEKCDIT